MGDAQAEQRENEEIGFDLGFTRRWLHYQNYAWLLIALILIAGLTGVLGRGPLSKETVSAGPGSLRATYQWMAHYNTPAVIQVELPSTFVPAGMVRLQLQGELVGKAKFQQVIPQPVSSAPLKDGVVLDIPLIPGSSRAKITITQEPSAVGRLISRISLEGGPSIQIDQFVLP